LISNSLPIPNLNIASADPRSRLKSSAPHPMAPAAMVEFIAKNIFANLHYFFPS